MATTTETKANIELYLINQYEAYRADEVGIGWSITDDIKDTVYYKSEVVEKKVFELPAGVNKEDIIRVHTEVDGSPILETATDVYGYDGEKFVRITA